MCQWYMAESPGEDGPIRNFACSMMDWNRIPKMLLQNVRACWIPYSVRPWYISRITGTVRADRSERIQQLSLGTGAHQRDQAGHRSNPVSGHGQRQRAFCAPMFVERDMDLGNAYSSGFGRNRKRGVHRPESDCGKCGPHRAVRGRACRESGTGETFKITANATDRGVHPRNGG